MERLQVIMKEGKPKSAKLQKNPFKKLLGRSKHFETFQNDLLKATSFRQGGISQTKYLFLGKSTESSKNGYGYEPSFKIDFKLNKRESKTEKKSSNLESGKTIAKLIRLGRWKYGYTIEGKIIKIENARQVINISFEDVKSKDYPVDKKFLEDFMKEPILLRLFKEKKNFYLKAPKNNELAYRDIKLSEISEGSYIKEYKGVVVDVLIDFKNLKPLEGKVLVKNKRFDIHERPTKYFFYWIPERVVRIKLFKTENQRRSRLRNLKGNSTSKTWLKRIQLLDFKEVTSTREVLKTSFLFETQIVKLSIENKGVEGLISYKIQMNDLKRKQECSNASAEISKKAVQIGLKYIDREENVYDENPEEIDVEEKFGNNYFYNVQI